MLVHKRDPIVSSHVERPNPGMSTVLTTKYDDSKQLFCALKSETTQEGRDDIVLAALTRGVDCRALEAMLDQIEMESQAVNPKIGVRKANVLGRLYWYFFQRQGRRRLT